MPCPSCSHPLHPLESETTIGTRITLDHCGNCGGVWFDSYELSSLPHHEVIRLAKLTVNNRSSNNESRITNNVLICPHDHHLLRPLETDTIPLGLAFSECPKCHGIWGGLRSLDSFAESMEEQIKIGRYEKIFPDTTISLAPLLALILLFFTTFITLYSFQKTEENRIQAQTLITSLTAIPVGNDMVLLDFTTSMPVTSKISYGPSRIEMRTQDVSVDPATHHTIRIVNLSSGKAYLYNLTLTDTYGKTYTTPQYIFKTP